MLNRNEQKYEFVNFLNVDYVKRRVVNIVGFIDG